MVLALHLRTHPSSTEKNVLCNFQNRSITFGNLESKKVISLSYRHIDFFILKENSLKIILFAFDRKWFCLLKKTCVLSIREKTLSFFEKQLCPISKISFWFFWIFILTKKCSYHSKNFHPWISFLIFGIYIFWF